MLVLLPVGFSPELGVIGRAAQLLARLGMPQDLAFSSLEFAANIALFVPLGALLPCACARETGEAPLTIPALAFVLTVPLGFAISLGIETAQRWIPGRVSDPRDLVSNTVGTLCGLIIAMIWYRSTRAQHT